MSKKSLTNNNSENITCLCCTPTLRGVDMVGRYFDIFDKGGNTSSYLLSGKQTSFLKKDLLLKGAKSFHL